MPRKIEIKKVDDTTKCQVTFSKRRSSLMKKIQEIVFLCGVDVVFVAFSPAGRLHKFCSKPRIEDLLQLYINLPTEMRLTQMKNIEANLKKLRQLGHISGDNNKLDHLEKQVENLEAEIRKRNYELEFLEANLSEYEPSLELVEPSWHQWCEKNLLRSLKRVMARKDELFGSSSSSWSQHNMQFDGSHQVQEGMPMASMFDKIELNKCLNQNSLSNQLQMEMVNQGQWGMLDNSPSFIGQLATELDPWISPYSAKVRSSMFEHLLDEARGKVIRNKESVNPTQGTTVGDSTTFGVQQQNPPPIFEQGAMEIAQVAPILADLPNANTTGEQVQHNASLGFQQHEISHYVNNQNGQDGAQVLNQLDSNQRQFHPFSSDDSNIPLRIEIGSGSRGLFDSHQLEFGREMPQSKHNHHIIVPESLLPDSSHSALADSQSVFHPQMDHHSLMNMNEVRGHEVGDFSRALHQRDPTPQTLEPQRGKNQWTSRNQNSGVLGWDELIEELFSD